MNYPKTYKELYNLSLENDDPKIVALLNLILCFDEISKMKVFPDVNNEVSISISDLFDLIVKKKKEWKNLPKLEYHCEFQD